jgi:thiol:disulfide interchange protein
MKKGIISIVTVALIVSSYGCVGEAKSESGEDSSTVSDNAQATTDEETDGIQFFTGTWDEALEKAKEENKLIFLDAYASWCGPCKRMSKSVFTDEKVGEFFNANFINFKMDMEKGVGPMLSKKFGLKSYPTLYFIGADEEFTTSVVGYHSAESLLEFAKFSLPSQ